MITKQRSPSGKTTIAFRRIAETARVNCAAIVTQWLPRGKRIGIEWCTLNPRRSDHKIGSFRINLRTGAWADFAIDERGGDLISLAAYLYGLSQAEAALKVAQMLGVSAYD
jgi:hypothetical protein